MAASTAAMMMAPLGFGSTSGKKVKLALVGTGIRGVNFWGKNLIDNYNDHIQFVGLCDINPGRLTFSKKYMGAQCRTFSDFEKMVKETEPDIVIVTTVDSTHHEFIIRGMELGCDVITEKPMTTDEVKCQQILDAEKKTGKKVIVGFNYRYGPHKTKIKELIMQKRIGELVSVDFHWYLNVYHGASYFRRWHGLRDKSGTLLVHKSTHHFDLLNWWLDSEPEQVFAYGALEHYGKNNAFRHIKCRGCPHKSKCKFFWDITKNSHLMRLYTDHEHHDGYLRDACLWREEIDIFDKMAVQIQYANNVHVGYSLTTYSPYEGFRIGFNGTKGRIDSWEGIPWQDVKPEDISQEDLHALEMSQNITKKDLRQDTIMVMDNFGKYEKISVTASRKGHGGGDKRLQNQTFIDPHMPDPMHHAAGIRDGAMSILLGIAARKSIDEKRPVLVGDLTSLKPQMVRPKS